MMNPAAEPKRKTLAKICVRIEDRPSNSDPIRCRTNKPGMRASDIALKGSFSNLMNIPFSSDF